MKLTWVVPVLVAAACASPTETSLHAEILRDDEAGELRFEIDGVEALTYQYGSEWAIPHIWPLRSPSGRSLLVQKTEPFAHHRSLWIVDRVQLGDGPVTDFYHEWSNLRDKEQPGLGHHSFIRHDEFSELHTHDRGAAAIAELTWVVQDETPVLDQSLRIELEELGDGEFMLHLAWEMCASHGPVRFLSDWVHYAWPYLRMDPAFSGEQGGTIADDQGREGQEATNEKYAKWIDYSNTIDGVTEGVAVFLPDDGQPRKWLTREYGTFGPRRADAWSGTKFTLERGETLSGTVTLLVHRGDVDSGRVAERYRSFKAAPERD